MTTDANLGRAVMSTAVDLAGLAKGLSNAQSQVTKSVRVLSTTFAGISTFALKAGDDIRTSYGQIQAGTGATGQQLVDLQTTFHEVFGETAADAGQVADAIQALNTRFGLTGVELNDLVLQTVRFSEATGQDGVAAMDSIGRAMSFFGVEAGNASGIFDQFVAASQSSGIEMQQLAGLTQRYGAVLSTAGFSIEETAGLMAQMHAAGVDVSRVMPGLNRAFRDAADAGVKGKDVFNALVPALRDAETETEALRIATDVLGAEGATRFVAFARQGGTAGDAITTAMSQAAGATATMYDHSVTTSDQLNILKQRLVEGAGGVSNFIGPTLNLAASLGSAALGVSTMSGVLPALSTAMRGAGVAMRFMLGPAGLIITAVGALGAAAILLYKNWDTVWPKIKSVFEPVANFVKSAYDSSFGWLLPGGALIKGIGLVRDNWDAVWTRVKSVFEPVANFVKSAYDSSFGWVLPGGALIKGLAHFSDVWRTIWDFVREKFDGFVSGLRSAAEPLLGLFGVEFPDAVQTTADTAELELPKVKTALTDVDTTASTVATNYVSSMSQMSEGTGEFTDAAATRLDELKTSWATAKDETLGTVATMFEEVGFAEEGRQSQYELYLATQAKARRDADAAAESETKTAAEKAQKAAEAAQKALQTAAEEAQKAAEKAEHDHWKALQDERKKAYDKRNTAQLEAQKTEAEAQAKHFKSISESTGVHLTNIESMYAASGLKVAASFSDVLSAIDGQIDGHLRSWNASQGRFNGDKSYSERIKDAFNKSTNIMYFKAQHDKDGKIIGYEKRPINELFGSPSPVPPSLPGLPPAPTPGEVLRRSRSRRERNSSSGVPRDSWDTRSSSSGGGGSSSSSSSGVPRDSWDTRSSSSGGSSSSSSSGAAGGDTFGYAGGFTHGMKRMIIGETPEALIPLSRMDEVLASYVKARRIHEQPPPLIERMHTNRTRPNMGVGYDRARVTPMRTPADMGVDEMLVRRLEGMTKAHVRFADAADLFVPAIEKIADEQRRPRDTSRLHTNIGSPETENFADFETELKVRQYNFELGLEEWRDNELADKQRADKQRADFETELKVRQYNFELGLEEWRDNELADKQRADFETERVADAVKEVADAMPIITNIIQNPPILESMLKVRRLEPPKRKPTPMPALTPTHMDEHEFIEVLHTFESHAQETVRTVKENLTEHLYTFQRERDAELIELSNIFEVRAKENTIQKIEQIFQPIVHDEAQLIVDLRRMTEERRAQFAELEADFQRQELMFKEHLDMERMIFEPEIAPPIPPQMHSRPPADATPSIIVQGDVIDSDRFLDRVAHSIIELRRRGVDF